MSEDPDQARDQAYVYSMVDEEAYLQADDEKPAIIPDPIPDLASGICAFCRKSAEQVSELVAGRIFTGERRVGDPDALPIAEAWICNECIARYADTNAPKRPGTPP